MKKRYPHKHRLPEPKKHRFSEADKICLIVLLAVLAFILGCALTYVFMPKCTGTPTGLLAYEYKETRQ